MLASRRAAARSVQPLLTLGVISVLGIAVAADVTGLLAPASVWGTLAFWNLVAGVALALASLSLALVASLASATSTPSRRAELMRDLILVVALVAAAASLVLRVRGDGQLPAAPAVMSALVALTASLVAAFFE